MKKIISLLLIFVLLISFSSCRKRIDEDVAVLNKEETNSPVVNDTPAKKDDVSAEKTDDKEQTQVSEPISEENNEQIIPIPEQDEQPEENPLEKEFIPTDVYVAEYLPLKLGYVKKQTNNGKTFYYNAWKDFETREPITEQMIDAAKKYELTPYFDYNGWKEYKSTVAEHPVVLIGSYNEEYVPGCYVRQSDPNGCWFGFPERYDTDLDYFESWLQDDTFVVKGHFEEGYGISYAKYSVNSNYKFGFNYEIDPYTVHNFVIDKVYDENCGYKAGDIVEVGLGGTIMQNYDGFYCAVDSGRYMTSHQEYVSFKDKTLEERTFILSLKPPSVQNRPDFLTVDLLSHNAYDSETVYKFSNRAYGPECVTAKEILEKYN